jgi:hypothetical protein
MGFRITGCGWWEYERTAQSGTFVCPAEGMEREYQIRRVNRWITLFYVPVIPLGTLGTFVRCKRCKNKFGYDAISQSSAATAAGQ